MNLTDKLPPAKEVPKDTNASLELVRAHLEHQKSLVRQNLDALLKNEKSENKDVFELMMAMLDRTDVKVVGGEEDYG